MIFYGKSFNQLRILRNHIKAIHEGHKDYKCVACGKSFNQSISLNLHMKTVHEGQKITNVIFVQSPSVNQFI